MRKIALTAALMVSATLAFSQDQATQSGSATQNARLALSNAIDIGFYSSYYGGTQNLAFNGVNDYANGKTTGWQILIVKSNKDYNVTLKTNNANFTYSGSTTPTPQMPASVLRAALYYNNTGGTINNSFYYNYTPLSANEQTLVSNAKQGGFQYFFMRYKALPGFAYPAGTYTIDAVYTATQN